MVVEIVTVSVRCGKPTRISHHAGGRQQVIAVREQSSTEEFIRLAETYPDAYIAWFDERLEPFLSGVRTWPDLVRHPLEILHLSCFQRCDLMVKSLGLVDFDSPFLLPGPIDRRYPTWLISPMAGIGHSSVFRAVGLDPSFKELAASLFELGHRGIRQGLCPYSEPRLLRSEIPTEVLEDLRQPLSTTSVALLIRRCFGSKWLLFWTVGSGLFQQSWPWSAALRALITKTSHFGDARLIEGLHPHLPLEAWSSIDVVIATLNRAEHVRNLLQDLAEQSVPPKKVFLIEQDPDGVSRNLISESLRKTLPFELDQHLLPEVGVCRARNLGLRKAASEWVLLLDDDVRLRPGFITYLLKVAGSYHVEAVNAATYVPGQEPDEVTAAGPVRVWAICGTAALLVRRRLVTETGFFDEDLEGGYGEDYEYGVRLRLNGGNVLYAPGQPVLHLKAPSGGFRQPLQKPWANEDPQPRPSPILLYSKAKHATKLMQEGYRFYYWLKRLGSTPVYRWPWELPAIRRQWKSAAGWAGRIASQSERFRANASVSAE